MQLRPIRAPDCHIHTRNNKTASFKEIPLLPVMAAEQSLLATFCITTFPMAFKSVFFFTSLYSWLRRKDESVGKVSPETLAKSHCEVHFSCLNVNCNADVGILSGQGVQARLAESLFMPLKQRHAKCPEFCNLSASMLVKKFQGWTHQLCINAIFFLGKV